jgi:hypothetical protein
MCISDMSHACYMPRLPHPPSFAHPNNVSPRVYRLKAEIAKEARPRDACAAGLPGAFSWKVFAEGSCERQRCEPIPPCEVICLAHLLRSPQPLARSSAHPTAQNCSTGISPSSHQGAQMEGYTALPPLPASRPESLG